MIKKLKVYEETPSGYKHPENIIQDKINELVDAVNAIQKEREAERFEIQEWIGILEAVRKSVNVHEKQIDDLQMKVNPEKHDYLHADLDDTDDIAEVKNENLYTKSMRMDKEFAEEEMERLQKELARTKKQLEIAVDALKLFCSEDVSYYSQSKIDARDARTALEQITALEQKDK